MNNKIIIKQNGRTNMGISFGLMAVTCAILGFEIAALIGLIVTLVGVVRDSVI